jgi:hypothetical protein
MSAMGRYLALRTVVAAADVLPYRVSTGTMRGLASLECRFSPRGRAARAEAAVIMNKHGREGFTLARDWMAIQYMDLIDLRRASTGREDLARWTVEEVNNEAVLDRVEKGLPILRVGGHFSFASILPLALRYPELSPVGVAYAKPAFKLDGDVLIARLMLGIGLQLANRLRPEGVQMSYVGVADVQGDLIDALSKPNGVGAMLIDVFWNKPNAYRRPYCGTVDTPFAVGAARVARLAQVPVVVSTSQRTGRRSSCVYYSDLYFPGAADDASGDIPLMNQLVDELERYVGRFRAAYPRFIGWQRRWDEHAEAWVAIEGDSSLTRR